MRTEDIKSDGYSLKALFREVSYEIDYYQRDYTWGEEEVRTLLRDLCESFNGWSGDADLIRKPRYAPQYFLGPFVFYEERRGRRFLVDGQQRFVTLHLIFLHLRSLMKILGDEPNVDRLNRVITKDDHSFCIGIPDHEPVLRAISEERAYEPGPGDSLSRRNLWARGQQIESLLREMLDSDKYGLFIGWLLERVVLVGIQAASRDHGYRMFETMNDRGARLTAIDLLKSFLLSRVGTDEEKLNDQWRQMLSELVIDRDDRTAPARFIKSVLLARHARLGSTEDQDSIEANLNFWVRRYHPRLKLTGPERYFRFVEDLLDTAKLYRPFLAASRELKDDFEAVFFNERNGLGDQMIAILAAVNPMDTPTEANEKGRRIAEFIDRWYVLRVLQDLPVQVSDVADLVHNMLVPALRTCRTGSDVAETLSRLADQADTSILDATTFGLRGNNRHQVRYILARVTAFVEKSVGRHTDILAYLDGDKFHIEHLWPNHHRRVAAEISDPVVFRTRRNQLGGLGLLPGRENSSLNDMPFHDKSRTYGRFTTLLGILAPEFNTGNTPLREFIKRNKLEKLLRPFGSKESMTTVVTTRQELYLRLCTLIWDTGRLNCSDKIAGLPCDRTPSRPDSQLRPDAPRSKAKRRTDVARMLNAGVLRPGERIVLTYRGKDNWATIDKDGGIVLDATGGTPYDRPDDAGAAVRGTKTCKGMSEWHIQRGTDKRVSLRALKEQAEVAGQLTRNRR